MHIIETNVLDKQQKSRITGLWNRGYPQKLAMESAADFDSYLEKLSDIYHLLLIDEEQNLKGWMACFNREGERWFALILDSSIHGQGWGSQLLDYAKECNTALNGWVIESDEELKRDGSTYPLPLGFYEKHGFGVHHNITAVYWGIRCIKVTW